MIAKNFCAIRMSAQGVLSALVLGAAGTSMAEVVPLDFTAAPDTYKVSTQNDQYRLVEGTWKPGHRDAFHSHPPMLYYWLTSCSLRFRLPDGTQRDATVSPGQAGTQAAVASHSVENMGQSECKIIMLEPK